MAFFIDVPPERLANCKRLHIAQRLQQCKLLICWTNMARKGTQSLSYLRSPCPIAGALDFLGDKWTLVIVRDLVAGKRRYGDFEKSPEKIPTNILADRLRQLESHGIIRKTPYQTRPVRHEYRLTKKGSDLLPILQAMARWSSTYVGGCAQPPDWFFKLTPKDLDRE